MKRNDITCITMTKFSRRHREIAEQFAPENVENTLRKLVAMYDYRIQQRKYLEDNTMETRVCNVIAFGIPTQVEVTFYL